MSEKSLKSKRVVVAGSWGITKDHDFRYTLAKTAALWPGKQKLLFKAGLIEVGANSLTISVDSVNGDSDPLIRRLQLKGKWQADRFNRLQFAVAKARVGSRPITFNGSWEVRNNSLVYSYSKAKLKTKTKRSRALRFKGYWEINKTNRLTYILDAKTKSAFDFKAYLETPNLIAKPKALMQSLPPSIAVVTFQSTGQS